MEVSWDTQTIQFYIYSQERGGTYRRYPGTPRKRSSVSTPRTGGGPNGGILGHLDNIVLHLLIAQEGDLQDVSWDTQTIAFYIYSQERRGTYKMYPGTHRHYSSISTLSRTGGGPNGGILGHLDNIVLYLFLGKEGDLQDVSWDTVTI